MEELLALLAQILGDDHELVAALQQRVDGETPWAEAEDDVLESVLAEIASVATNDEVTTEAIIELADVRDEVVAEQASREEARAADEARRAEALARITGETEEEPEGEPEEGEEETPETEEEPEGEEAQVEAEPEPVTAATEPARPPLAAINQRRPAVARPRERETLFALTAAAGIPNVAPGGRFRDIDDFGDALLRTWQAGIGTGARGRTPVGRFTVDYPEDRFLDGDSRANDRKIAEVQRQLMALDYRAGEEALVAAGGLCAPTAARYDQIGISEEARPLRAALPRFGADRGGIRFNAPPQIADLASAITVWTEANDASPADPTTKACLTISCEDITEVTVDAIVQCLQFGNFQARTFRESVERNMQLANAQHSRVAEDTIWDAICSGSTAVVSGQNLGAARDVLENIDQAASAYRYRHRMSPMAPLVFVAPFWLLDMMRADLTRQLPGDGTMAVTDAQINGWFSVRNIRVVWSWDSGATNDAYRTAQAAGGLTPWPSTVETLLFHEGAWLFLDGGELDLGIVRDSTLNSTNDFQMFSETFENVAFVGIESLCLTLDLCPDGTSSGTSDIDPCTIGS